MIYLKDGNIPLNLAYDDDIVQEANSTYQLSFKFPLTDGKWNLLRREVFLLADDLHGEQEFFIFEVKKAKGHVQVYAKQVATLLNYYSINSISVDRVPGQTVMTALAGSVKRPCPFTFFSDILDRHTFNESNVSVMAALAKDKHSIVGQWGGDLVRDKYQVKLLKNGGIENESLFMYKKNLSSYEESENINNLKTRLHLKKTIKGQSEGEADRVIAVTVDSPLIGQYRQIYEADIEVNDQDVTDVASLTAYGKRYFSSTLCDLVENSINLDVKGKSDVSVKMFDMVSVFHERFDVDLRLKISSYHFGPMSKRLKSIGFGKVSQSFGSTVASMVAGSVDKATGRLSASFEQKLQKEIDNANRHFDAEFDKRVESINDGIEQAQAEAERYADAIKQEIDTEIAQVNQSMQSQEQEHDREVANILSKTQSVESLANQAKSDAANALASATQLKADAVNEAQRLVNTLKTETVTSSNQLKQQIETVGNQLSSQQDELLQATQTVRGLDTQVKSVANQLGTQQTTITQLVNDGNARGQKIADFETSLDGVTTKLQNLWNGSRNLLSNTELLTGYEGVLPYPKNHYLNKAVFRWTHKATDTAFKEGLVMQVNDTLVNPKEMIVSFYAVANRSTTIRCYMFNPNGRKAVETSTGYTATNVDGYAEVTIGTAWRRYWVRYTYQVGYVAKPYVIIGRSPDTVTADSTVSIVAPALYHGHYNRDWQPSDIDMTSDFAIYKQTIDQNLAQLGSDIRTANGSVTSLRTEYNQTKTEIALLASKSDFDALTQKTQSLEASLKVQAGKIDLKAEKTSIDSINQQISSAQAELTVVNDAIAQRVTKTDFNAVKRTAEANATAITQVNNAIELKAEKTYVDGIKSTADNAMSKANTNASTITQTKAELKIVSDTIETKATKTDLNNLTGRMSTAETTIRTQAGQIEQRLTATQVNELVDGKGYATSSSVQNIVKETADSFSRTISAVENNIPTEAGGTNLVRGSADLKQGANGWREGHWRNSGSGGTVEYNATLPSSPVKGIVKGVKIVNNDNNQIGLCQDGIALEPGTYTMSVWVIGSRGLKVHISGAYSQDTSNPFASGNTFVTLGRYGWTLISQTFTLDKRYENLTLGYMMLDSAGTVYFAAPYIHKSSMSGDWSPAVEDLATVTALHEVKDTVSSHTRTIGAVGTSGSILDNVSKVTQTAAGLVAEVSGSNGLKTQVSTLAGSYAMKNLTSAGTVLNQLNLNKDGSIKLDGSLVQITGKTYIQDGVISSAKIGSLDAGKITTGTLNAARIAVNSIDGSKLVFDQAFVNKMTANEALFKQLFAQNAFITSVQSTTMSADMIKGGLLISSNGATNFDLNNGNLLFNNNYGYIRRTANDKIFEITTLLTEKSDYSPEGLSSKFMIRKSDSSRQSGVSFNLYTTVNGKPTATTQIYSDSFTITSSDYTTLFSLGSKNSYLGTLNLQNWGDIPVAVMSGGLVVKDIGIGGHTESLLKVVERLCSKTGLMWI
ncbi:TPA: hypothetical protein U1B35_002013 [Streptococcus suis]|nr:hypothetical protein [Streptococcus suis]